MHQRVWELKNEGKNVEEIYAAINNESDEPVDFNAVTRMSGIAPSTGKDGELVWIDMPMPTSEEFDVDRAGAYNALEYLTYTSVMKAVWSLAKREQRAYDETPMGHVGQIISKMSTALNMVQTGRRLEEGKSTANVSIAALIEMIDKEYQGKIVGEKAEYKEIIKEG